MTQLLQTSVAASKAARSFSDLLNRVRYRGERFLIVRNGETVAELSPTHEGAKSLVEVIEALSKLPGPDPEFAQDLAEIRRSQPPMPEDLWDS